MIIAEERLSPVVELGKSVFNLEDQKMYPILESDELDEEMVRQGFLACEIEPFIAEIEDVHMILEQQYWQAKLEELMPTIEHHNELLNQKKLILFHERNRK